MIRMVTASLVLALATLSAMAEERVAATLYKIPNCSCCKKYADYLRTNGFDVTVIEAPDMTPIKQKYGVGKNLEGCHTAVIGGYVVEGHVPVGSINRLLSEKPAIKGITLPGMPPGSPGMSGSKTGSFEILSITGQDAAPAVFATE
ncbi:MAG: DUF411 domain-containing protein [Hyphomicrobium sp.]|uniref:DUF411 domain-containing protein n=1 Tax=Hyphomicrobium sp. TaxID=82 RepID=UPI001325F2C0|nr:DUF411 domain-containing protein [Hyphomicrobium sp.]KAB2943611.1 MAG: DUF411 domain-containing protein [Hyphomicrobium sp.]MBZ0208929.1 DUF411 domain-containing protein [Hyphomicrobium sp.]